MTTKVQLWLFFLSGGGLELFERPLYMRKMIFFFHFVLLLCICDFIQIFFFSSSLSYFFFFFFFFFILTSSIIRQLRMLLLRSCEWRTTLDCEIPKRLILSKCYSADLPLWMGHSLGIHAFSLTWTCLVWFGLVGFYGISTFVVFLMSNPFIYI